ncbi:hypothetical protein [Ralstonia sp. CP]|uniref:hypothetical protein n=1 Tax=Ralstonia sp. CP TaxID=3231757 RepID=UPI00345B8C64
MQATQPEVAHALAIVQAVGQQPQLVADKRMQKLGTVHYGDLLVDLHGLKDKRGEVDLWDVTLADTMVSLESVIDKTKGGQWDELQQEAQDIADGMRSPYPAADDYRAEDQRERLLGLAA